MVAPDTGNNSRILCACCLPKCVICTNSLNPLNFPQKRPMFKSPWYRQRNYTSHHVVKVDLMLRAGHLLEENPAHAQSSDGQVLLISDLLAVHLHPS